MMTDVNILFIKLHEKNIERCLQYSASYVPKSPIVKKIHINKNKKNMEILQMPFLGHNSESLTFVLMKISRNNCVKIV